MNFVCLVCQNSTLQPIPEFSSLPRVTSDCKPWPNSGVVAVCESCGMIQKPADKKWLQEIREVYDAYELFYQGDGSEQPIFSPSGASAPRSRLLIDYLVERLSRYGSHGRLIDIGCGTGAALRNFATALPGWSLDGSELSDKALASLRSIKGFCELYTMPLAQIPQRYDVATMIHSLEHIVDPAAAVRDALLLLKSDGSLFVQVPDIETSPFDLLVVDHRSHFTRKTLGMLVARQGAGVDVLVNTVLPKEITFVGRRGTSPPASALPSDGIRIVDSTVRWLHAVLSAASEASRSSSFGIFGSSISAMWLYGALRERVCFFLDEDKSRIGRDIDGKPILAPADVPANSTVFVPLVPAVAGPLVQRLSRLQATFVVPPQ
ncbi:MAG: hypothetical protein QOI12_2760 [Alphaproteobacteria bacterium]|jgi:SAM-dependent methyltransferase|nr:hypothetical protein [Alphaproteobacteria bacterium]